MNGDQPAAWRNRIVRSGDAPLDEITLNPANWRTHPAHQKAALSELLGSVGYVQQVVINERSGRLVDGHLRVALAEQHGESSVPAVWVDLDDDEERLILATLDPLSALAETDAEQLASLLASVSTSDDALAAMLRGLAESAGIGDARSPAEDPGAQVDRAEELRVKWGTERGQLWEIGRHRLLCGDATSAEDVARLMGGERADMVLADPPYGMNLVGYAGGDNVLRGRALRQRTPQRVTGDDAPFDAAPLIALYGCREQFWWGGDWYYTSLPPGGSWIIWDKRTSEAADAVLGAPFEVCWSRQRHARQFIRKLWGGIFSKEHGDAERWHATQKPLAVMVQVLDWHAPDDGRVLDPFAGSGTVSIASEQTGRTCYAMEIQPRYVAVTLERLAGMGLSPRLADG